MAYKPLRPRQQAAVDQLRTYVARRGRRVILQAATGFGKTRLAAAVVESALEKSNRVLFVVPAILLVDQTVEMFYEQGIRDIGVIQANHEMTNPHRPVQVASVQTLSRRDVDMFDVVILDEVHRWFKFYEQFLGSKDMADVPVIGLSATPWTKGLGKHFDELIIAGTIKDGITEGWLSKYRAFAPTIPDLGKVRTVRGDYHEGDLSDVMNVAPLTADIVDTWRLYGQGRPTFVFAVDRAHAKRLQGEFERAGIRTGYIDSFTPKDERDDIRRKFEDEEIEVVCNVGVLTTGIDWDVRCVVLARPTKSEMLYVQMIGRGLRTTPEGKEEKDYLLILDHTGTTLNLGLVDDIHHDRLNTGNKADPSTKDKPTPLPKACPKCKFMKPPKVHVCPACGFKPEKKSKTEPEPGTLIEVGERPTHDRAFKQDWYSMLRYHAQVKGYQDGWIFHKYRAAFKEAPPPEFRRAEPKKPDEEILSWLLSQQIRYIKGKQRRASS